MILRPGYNNIKQKEQTYMFFWEFLLPRPLYGFLFTKAFLTHFPQQIYDFFCLRY